MAIAGRVGIVSGWGRNENKSLQPQLHFLEAKIVSNVICDDRWNAQGAARGFIVPSMMCMDSTSGDSCNVSYFFVTPVLKNQKKINFKNS